MFAKCVNPRVNRLRFVECTRTVNKYEQLRRKNRVVRAYMKMEAHFVLYNANISYNRKTVV